VGKYNSDYNRNVASFPNKREQRRVTALFVHKKTGVEMKLFLYTSHGGCDLSGALLYKDNGATFY
jgi:hypothetical protein